MRSPAHLCLLGIFLVACGIHHDVAAPGDGSSADSAGAGGNQRSESAAGKGSSVATGRAATAEVDLNPIQFEMNIDVPAGAELLKCSYAQLPTDRVTAIGSAESHYTPGSHHLLVYRSDLTSIPANNQGVWDCQDGSLIIHQRGAYYEAQQPDAMRALPDGIAHEFKPGEVIILQSHYINTTEADIAARVEFQLHQVDPATVEQEAGTLFFNDPSISVPAHSRASVTMTCPILDDINPALLWSHMHSRGVHFVATTDDPAAADALGTLYESDDWSEPQPREYPTDPPVVLHAGSHITFSCEYLNDTDSPFMFGQSAETNEMCILHGMYWPRMSLIGETCLTGVTSRARL